jgi:RimJ/RimL family protein N-acetyltransferase
MLGQAIGPSVINDFLCQVVFQQPDINSIISDPEESNERSLRAFEKARFRPGNRVQLAGESFTRRILQMDRRDFLQVFLARKTN